MSESTPHEPRKGGSNDAQGATPAPPPGSAGSNVPAGSPPQGSPVALIASVVMHVILLTTLGLIWHRTPSGTGAEPDREIGIAMVERLPDRNQYTDASEIEPTEQADSESASSSSAAAPPTNLAPPIDLAGVLKEITESPVPTSGSGLAGDNPLGGDTFGSGPGDGASNEPAAEEATLFGVSGFGSRFVYVMDRSDSMNGFGGRPLRAAKKELSRSLGSLSKLQQFQIVFYNDQPKPFQASGGPAQLVTGETTLVHAAKRYVQSVRAFGGTEHITALKMALRMRPDVIFFLTDARIPRLSGSQLSDIRSRAVRGGTTIHAIEFGTDPAAPSNSFLIDLAEQNGGQYRYINVQQL